MAVPTLLTNLSLLLGEELEFVERGSVWIEEGAIRGIDRERAAASEAARADGMVVDCGGLLAIPGFVDAHTHIGDSLAKDAGIGLGLDEVVHPVRGLKAKILGEAPRASIVGAMARTIQDMVASGITAFADFREGGLDGIAMASDALRGQKKIRAVLLGRPSYHFGAPELADEATELPPRAIGELQRTLDACSGVGLSGANEYTESAMRQISEVARSRGKTVAIHASESTESKEFSLRHFSTTEVLRVLRCIKPDFLVHLTNSTEEEMRAVALNGIPVVCCPRANSVLGVGFPPLEEFLHRNLTVALGTDNVMLNSPDMFREMDYASKMVRAVARSPSSITSKDVLKMATINGARAIGLGSKVGSIDAGKRADIVFIDIEARNLGDSRDMVASIVHRARTDNIAAVMIDGEIVHGSI